MAITKSRGFAHYGDRYTYDLGLCKRWAQVDTKQDASYYGTWACPQARRIFSYCEGDTHLTVCDTDEEFAAEMLTLMQWHQEMGYWLGVDPGLAADRVALWMTPELQRFLHPSTVEYHQAKEVA